MKWWNKNYYLLIFFLSLIFAIFCRSFNMNILLIFCFFIIFILFIFDGFVFDFFFSGF